MRWIILCPLKREMRDLVAGLNSLGTKCVPHQKLRLSSYAVPEWDTLITWGGHGKSQFAVHTQYALSEFPRPKGVLCVGTAGGLNSNLQVGDLVIGDRSIEHDFREKLNPNASMPIFEANVELLRMFNRPPPNLEFNVHVGGIASGDEDIASAQRANELHQQTGALAVAWEGSGGARACRFLDVPYLEVRAITDNAREKVTQSFAQNLGRCMRNVATLLCELLA